jgi:membrane-bound lytic murein transglycosylase D
MNVGTLRIIVVAAAILAGAWLPSERALGASGGTAERPDDIYRRAPELLALEQKLDRASTYYFFGQEDIAVSAANDLVQAVAGLRSTSTDGGVCERLDDLENRALCLLRRISDDEIERETSPHIATLIDSVALNNVVEEEIEIEYNGKTEHWIDYFQGSGRKYFSRWLARVGSFRDVIEPILVDVGIPRDLLYLAVIESGLNLSAKSYMKAIGPWQFMTGTGKLFGLRINWWLDERKDIVAATYAAANYLKYLYDLFGSWPLALAAYNSGEHRVARAITTQRTTDYWQLRLPAQTTWFVPKFMAALAIGRDPEAYGFEKPPSEPLEFDIIEIERPTELRKIAEAADCSLSEIKDLNPHFKKWCTPPDMVVEVKVPKGAGEACSDRLAAMKKDKLQSFVQHKVKRGETLSGIAAQHEVTVKDIRSFNEIAASQSIHTGNILLIPVKDTVRSARVASRPSYRNPDLPREDISLPLLSAIDGGRQIRYIVKKDDSIVKIAERFHASLAQIREWNGLTYDSVLRPGDTIRIRVAQSPGIERQSSPAGLSASAAGKNDPPRANEAPPAGDGSTANAGERRITHVVRKGETLSAIGRLYKVGVSDILSWNRKTNRNKLYPGEKITIWVKAG